MKLQSVAVLHVAQIFNVILNTVRRKQYKPEWREERNTFARNDLQEALIDTQTQRWNSESKWQSCSNKLT